MAKKQRSSGGDRKKDRNRVWCKAYALSNRREKNKVAKLEKRLLTHPNDRSAQSALDRAKNTIRGV